jgi:hypothetical protein
MRLKKAVSILILSGILFPLSFCKESGEPNNGLLKQEFNVFEKSAGQIQDKYKKLKEAERNNQLQSQLDLKRELDALISGMNNTLTESKEKQDSGKTISFSQPENPEVFDVSEVKLIKCHFNEEIMDLQVQLVAVAKAKENKNNFLSAGLCDSSGRRLKEIKFYMTNDYPEKGKNVLLLAHVEGAGVLKYFSKIKFN